jgi:GAF domain-containing protein
LARIVTDDEARIRAFTRTLAERIAQRREPFRFGTALFCDSLPKVWDLNYLRVESPAGAPELAAEAEAVHAAAGHGHRKILVEDEGPAAALRPELEALGWATEADVVMILRRPADRPADTSGVSEVSEDVLAPAREAGMLAEAWPVSDPESVRQVLAAERLLDEATDVRRFAWLVGGEVASYCDLYSDGPTAQIESVMTLPEFRNRGLARAVITRAAEEAGAAGAELVFLFAEEDDWPKKLYEKLGFDITRRVTWFAQTPATRIERALAELLGATGATRVTLRRDVQGAFFPVTHEALAPGANSIRDGAGIDLRSQPVARQLEETGAQVVQNDCASAFDDPEFHRMREAYGGLASQIVTPVLDEGRLVGIVSLHQCGAPRTWTDEEIALAAGTADRVKEVLRA